MAGHGECQQLALAYTCATRPAYFEREAFQYALFGVAGRPLPARAVQTRLRTPTGPVALRMAAKHVLTFRRAIAASGRRPRSICLSIRPNRSSISRRLRRTRRRDSATAR